MSISATQGANVGALANVDAITRARAGAASAKAPGSARDRTSVSGPGAMLSKLKELQDKDPAKFTAAMSDIATKLDDAAKASTDPKEQKALSELSAKFKTAGETGDLSALGPPKHGKGGPPGGGAPRRRAPRRRALLVEHQHGSRRRQRRRHGLRCRAQGVRREAGFEWREDLPAGGELRGAGEDGGDHVEGLVDRRVRARCHHHCHGVTLAVRRAVGPFVLFRVRPEGAQHFDTRRQGTLNRRGPSWAVEVLECSTTAAFRFPCAR